MAECKMPCMNGLWPTTALQPQSETGKALAGPTKTMRMLFQKYIHVQGSSRVQKPFPELAIYQHTCSLWFLSVLFAEVLSLEATIHIGHFLLIQVVRRGETSVDVAVT